MTDDNLSIVKEDNIKKFWLSFTTWFEDELPGTGILQTYYEDYDNWNGGTYYLGIDFEKRIQITLRGSISRYFEIGATSNGRYKDVYRDCIS